LEGKVVGSVGLGNIAREMFRLLEPFDLGDRIAYDPFVTESEASRAGVKLVSLESVFRNADFVTINCPLNKNTRGSIGASLINLMKPTAYLINTARGPIINERDLIAALECGAIAGAGLDVFEEEPLPEGHPFIRMEQVILAPHALAWTDDLYRNNSVMALENLLAVFQGGTPRYIVNKQVLEQPQFRSRQAKLASRWEAFARKG
jgi:phosphoglycerate dehydrogenase-like enzyme